MSNPDHDEPMSHSPHSSSSTSTSTPTPPPPPPPGRPQNSQPNARKQTMTATTGAATQFIGDLPIARDEAMSSFTEISDNWYQYKTLGRVRELEESMMCDCTFDPDYDERESACGHGSDCINRLTQIECLSGFCRCRSYCLNQRFQKKQYASIEIVKTEKKGYGLRAEQDIHKDFFIYEYVGDVVNNASFKKRMREYAKEGIEHFYFMMLQKDEFIDATKSGGIGRFANHSCNPNCYVAKWTIDQHVRMGIFAKRNIKKDEELTFNYNVDRYGHQAQACYCGEPNCVGFIGGKTQTETDISTMDELYLDALGITDDDELRELKGTRKKKGKKIDDLDFMPTMKPVTEHDAPKIVQAIRQTQSKKMMFKLLSRLKITEDRAALRQVMRLRGFSLMKNILEDYVKDMEVIALALECMFSWPLIARNKVEDSQISVPVKVCVESKDESVKSWAEKLISHWDTLELSYRIPKRPKREELNDPDNILNQSPSPLPPSPTSALAANDPNTNSNVHGHSTTHGYAWAHHVAGHNPERRPTKRLRQFQPPSGRFIVSSGPSPGETMTMSRTEDRAMEQAELAAIIERAKADKEEAERKLKEQQLMQQEEEEAEKRRRKRKEEERKVRKEKKRSRDKDRDKDKDKEKREKRKEKASSSGGGGGSKDAEKEALKEKKLLKLISPVVVKSMSKYASTIGHERFKKHAKELTETIAEREKKSSAYRDNKLDSLSAEKTLKIKKYAKEYIDKLVKRLEAQGKHASRMNNGNGKRGTSDLNANTNTNTDSPGSRMSSSINSPSTSSSTAVGTITPTSAVLRVDMADVTLLDDDVDDMVDMDTDSSSESDDGSDLDEREEGDQRKDGLHIVDWDRDRDKDGDASMASRDEEKDDRNHPHRHRSHANGNGVSLEPDAVMGDGQG